MNKLRWTILISILGIALLFIIACDFNNITNPADDLEIRVTTISRDSFVSLEILDAATDELVDSEIEAEVVGDDAGLVINEINEPTTFFTIENGILLFAIADGTEPSEDNPVKLNIILKSEGYLNTSKPITVIQAGVSTYTTKMTNINNTPDGVVSNQEDAGATSGDGGMADSVTVSSGQESESGGEASISMSQGTQLMDGDGNVLTGNVEATVTYFNPLNEESIDAFPGGFSVEIDGEEEGTFSTAGFVAIDMTVNGTDVEQFNGDVNIDIKVPEGTINPETGLAVQPGDEIPIYSYDEDNGKWQYEGTTTVPEQDGLGKSNGVHTVKIKNIKHLSYWNLDWFYGGRCTSTITLVSTTGTFVPVRLKAAFVSGYGYLYSGYAYDPNVRIVNAPANRPVIIYVYEMQSGALLGQQRIENLCVDNQVSYSPPVTITVNLSVQITCDQATIRPSGFPLYARPDGGSWKYLGRVTDGTVSTTFYENEYYDFYIYFDGEGYYTHNYIDDIISHAAKNGVTLEKNSSGFIKMTASNTGISVMIKDVESVCDEF